MYVSSNCAGIYGKSLTISIDYYVYVAEKIRSPCPLLYCMDCWFQPNTEPLAARGIAIFQYIYHSRSTGILKRRWPPPPPDFTTSGAAIIHILRQQKCGFLGWQNALILNDQGFNQAFQQNQNCTTFEWIALACFDRGHTNRQDFSL